METDTLWEGKYPLFPGAGQARNFNEKPGEPAFFPRFRPGNTVAKHPSLPGRRMLGGAYWFD